MSKVEQDGDISCRSVKCQNDLRFRFKQSYKNKYLLQIVEKLLEKGELEECDQFGTCSHPSISVK